MLLHLIYYCRDLFGGHSKHSRIYTQLVWPLFDYQPHRMKLGIGIAANMILFVLDSPISVMWQGRTWGFAESTD